MSLRSSPQDGRSGAARFAATAFLGLFAAAHATSVSAVTFTNVTASSGISHVHTIAGLPEDPPHTLFFSGGAAAGDFDGDGWVDLVFTRINQPNILYRNLGNGTFESRTAAAGFLAATASNGVVSGDVDNDGDLDLYTTTIGATRNYLYLNDGAGFFTDAGTANGAAIANGQVRSGHGASFGDYDGDGYLDLAAGDWGNPVEVSQSRLLHNVGAAQPGQFADVTVAAGIDVYRGAYAFRYSPRFTDLDRDGHADLTFASDFVTSQLFWNDGDGTFTDGTIAAGVGTDPNGMGTTFADYDGDGDLDWFITCTNNNPLAPVHGGWNRLYRNDGNRTFTDVTQTTGVRDSGWSWGASFFDYDNDGDYDLAATNGWNGPGWSDDQTRLFRNDGGVFANVSTASGIVDTQQGRGLLHLDYDRDGDEDLVVVNNEGAPILYRNDGGNANHYLRIDAEGTASNRDGIGAWITVTPDLAAPNQRMVWEIDGGSSYLSQNERTAHFGLGQRTEPVDLVEIQWPSGAVQRLFDVSVDQTLSIVEADQWNSADFNHDQSVGGPDVPAFRLAFGQTAAADANGDGITDGFDALVWQRQLGAAAASGAAASPTLATVPEPCGVGLVAAAAGAMALRRRHKRDATSARRSCAAAPACRLGT